MELRECVTRHNVWWQTVPHPRTRVAYKLTMMSSLCEHSMVCQVDLHPFCTVAARQLSEDNILTQDSRVL